MAETQKQRFARHFHSREFVAFVKSQKCCCCGTRSVIQAAHVKSRGAGGEWERNIVPLCIVCHGDQTNRGILSFQIKHNVNLQDEADRLYQLWLKKNMEL